MSSPLRDLRAAFVFLTRVPVGGFPYRDEEWRRSTAYFPLVGAAIGTALAAVYLIAEPLGPWAAAILALATGLILTGGFHEDGLADTADALGGAMTRERLFEILKDSRVGTFGALALVVSIGLRVALLAELGPAAPAALVVAHSLSRLPPIWMMVALPYATPGGGKSRQVARARAGQALLATLWPVLIGDRLLRSGELAICLGLVAIAAVVLGRWFDRRAGGVTGDFLGATQQVCECAVLAALVWVR